VGGTGTNEADVRSGDHGGHESRTRKVGENTEPHTTTRHALEMTYQQNPFQQKSVTELINRLRSSVRKELSSSTIEVKGNEECPHSHVSEEKGIGNQTKRRTDGGVLLLPPPPSLPPTPHISMML
jgi:hypothetical protein